jgi:hypothetical protein
VSTPKPQKPQIIWNTYGDWMATRIDAYIWDLTGTWVAWLDGDEVFTTDGEWIGTLSKDSRILRKRAAKRIDGPCAPISLPPRRNRNSQPVRPCPRRSPS